MSYSEDISRHRRLAILRYLVERPEYTSNASIMQDVLGDLGLPLSYDALISELSWLNDQGFVSADTAAQLVVVVATRRGVDLARGLASDPGVQRPRPRA